MIDEVPLVPVFPAILPSDAIERLMELDSPASIPHPLAENQTAGLPYSIPQDLPITTTSERVVNFVVGIARSFNLWDRILKNKEAVGC